MPTIVIQPDNINGKDSTINSSSPTANYGTREDLYVGNYGAIYHSLLQFDISSLPKGIGIVSAQMSLFLVQTENDSTTSYGLTAHKVTQSWGEDTLTYNNQPNHDTSPIATTNVGGRGSWYTWDIKNLVKEWVSEVTPNNGILIKSSPSEVFFKRFWSSETDSADLRPRLTIEYNLSPSAPLIITPNGGEILDKTHEIAWDSGIDPEGSTLQYHIQLSSNNGSTWKDIVTLTSAGANSVNYNFINETESSTTKLRIRSFDGISYSPWDESDGVFTIQHNVAPTTPSNLIPSGKIIDRTRTNRFSWTHNDSPNDIQSKADLRWRTVGSALWNEIASNGPETEYYFAANTLPNGQIEWQVRTYDAAGLASPWSNISVFTASEPTTAPTIISPDSVVSVPRPVIQWTSASQTSYQIVIEDSLGVTVWDSGEVFSGIKARTIGVDLMNGGVYKVKVRVMDGSGLFSSFTEKTITVAYTPPAKPLLEAFKAEAAVQLVITTPQPTGTQPIVVGNDIYKVIDGRWGRIAANVSGVFTDYAVADGVEYRYFAVALGETGVYSYSDEVRQSVSFRGAYIHDPLDPEFTVQHFVYNGTGAESEYTPETTLMKFVGRKRPVAQYGNYGEFAVNITLQATSRDFTPMRCLREFVANRQPVCYRDDNGHFLYGIIQTLPITRDYNVETANITVVEIDYDPEV